MNRHQAGEEGGGFIQQMLHEEALPCNLTVRIHAEHENLLLKQIQSESGHRF